MYGHCHVRYWNYLPNAIAGFKIRWTKRSLHRGGIVEVLFKISSFWWLPWRGKNRLLCWDCLQKLVCNRFLQTAWVWQCPEASRHWHCECSTTLAISREVACKRFVFLFFNRRSTTSWYCNEWTSFRLVNLNKCIISNYLQVFSICHVFFFVSPIMHYVPKSVWVFFPMLYGSETLTKFPIFYLPKKGAEEQHLKEQIDNHRTLLNWSCNHCLYGKIVTKHFCCLECLIKTLYFIQFGLTIKRGLELWTLPQDPLHALMVYSGSGWLLIWVKILTVAVVLQ